VASVADAERERTLADAVTGRWGLQPWFARSTGSACGLTNSYTEPERLGVDRWLAMIAARRRAAGPVCVVDAGSALTIDFVAADGRHRGGYIVPGVAMMERALLGETARVRFGDAPRDQLAPGTSTEAAVYNGLQLAQVGTVATALERFGESDALVFCGGNGQLLQALLGLGGEFVPELVLDGLETLGLETGAQEMCSA
jgi:type III pantothenate kinase